MDMKKLLQAMDGISTKPVEGVDSMSKFLRVVGEADLNQMPDPGQDTQADGTPTYTADELADIQDPNAQEWVAVRNQIQDAKAKGIDPAEIAKLQAHYDQLAGGNAERWEQTYAKNQAVKAADQAAGYNNNVQYVNPTNENMDKFLSIVKKNDVNMLNEGSPHKVALPVQMAMNHYQTAVTPAVRKDRLIDKYFTEAEVAITQRKEEKRAKINQYANVIAERVLMKESKKTAEGTVPGHSMGFKPGAGPGLQPIEELSTELLGKYKKAAGADAKAADAEGDFERGNKRFKNINKATNKQFDNDLKKHGQKNVEELDEDLQRLYNLRDQIEEAIKQRLDPKCWKGKHKEGTKIKGGVRVNNCVPNKK